MDYVLHPASRREIAEVLDTTEIITTPQQFLDLVMNIPVVHIIIHAKSLDPSFFNLRSGMAGEILQKVANYRLQLAIVGDFSVYDSKALKDFIFESNKGNTVIFVSSLEEALKKLS
jgi:hypothetical protein